MRARWTEAKNWLSSLPPVKRWHAFDQEKRVKARRALSIFLITFGLNLLWQYRSGLPFWPGVSGTCGNEENHVSLGDKLFHEQVVERQTIGESKNVVLVLIGKYSPAAVRYDVCEGRRYMAHIIRALNQAGARVIAIDKFYGKESCEVNAANRQILDAMQKSHVPIVVGQPTQELPRDLGACVTTAEALVYGTPTVTQGLLQLNSDTLKIPLTWPLIPGEKADTWHVGDPVPESASFALTAVNAMRPPPKGELAQGASIQRLIKHQQHPIGRFRTTIPTLLAADLLCAFPSEATDADEEKIWHTNCRAMLQKGNLDGRIVVIGDAINSDQFPFFHDDVYGALLHAYYIDGLLSGEFMKEVPFWMEVLIWIPMVLLPGLFVSLNPSPGWMPLTLLGIVWIVLCLGGGYELLKKDYYPPIDLAVTISVALVGLFLNAIQNKHTANVVGQFTGETSTKKGEEPSQKLSQL